MGNGTDDAYWDRRVHFRKRKPLTVMAIGLLAAAANTVLVAVMVQAYAWAGLLTQFGIGYPTWGQAFIVGIVVSTIPRLTVGDYVEDKSDER